MLKTMEKAKGSPGNQHTGPVERDDQSNPTLSDLGISKEQSADWQKMGEVPDDEFEAALSGSNKPNEVVAGESFPVLPVGQPLAWKRRSLLAVRDPAV